MERKINLTHFIICCFVVGYAVSLQGSNNTIIKEIKVDPLINNINPWIMKKLYIMDDGKVPVKDAEVFESFSIINKNILVYNVFRKQYIKCFFNNGQIYFRDFYKDGGKLCGVALRNNMVEYLFIVDNDDVILSDNFNRERKIIKNKYKEYSIERAIIEENNIYLFYNHDLYEKGQMIINFDRNSNKIINRYKNFKKAYKYNWFFRFDYNITAFNSNKMLFLNYLYDKKYYIFNFKKNIKNKINVKHSSFKIYLTEKSMVGFYDSSVYEKYKKVKDKKYMNLKDRKNIISIMDFSGREKENISIPHTYFNNFYNIFCPVFVTEKEEIYYVTSKKDKVTFWKVAK